MRVLVSFKKKKLVFTHPSNLSSQSLTRVFLLAALVVMVTPAPAPIVPFDPVTASLTAATGDHDFIFQKASEDNMNTF